MSRFMQIDIRLIPFYEKPFEKTLPRLARILGEYGYKTPLEKDVSLYHLVDYLEDMMHESEVPSDIKDRLRPRVHQLGSLKETARQQLLGRHLNELDRTLYKIEDVFSELEKAL